MMRKTKEARLRRVIMIAQEHHDEELPLKQWLSIINEELHKNIKYRNTIELARAFKRIPEMKGRQTWTLCNRQNTSVVYYQYEQQDLRPKDL